MVTERCVSIYYFFIILKDIVRLLNRHIQMISYIVVSDIHLGHQKTPTKHIVINLLSNLLTEENKVLDIIFIAGDIFHRLLDLNSNDSHEIIYFFRSLLHYCSINNIKLRVLEGTPSHDWQQSKILLRLNDTCDLKYINILDIEYMPDLNINILYIPDEWNNDHSSIEKEINAKLIEYNISKVDIAIMHGQFKYQTLGKMHVGFYYNEEYFNNIVKYYIHIGHYHTYSYNGKIIAEGSFDRLSHGEEEDKGYVKAYIDNNICNYEFIINKNAFIYKTINVRKGMTLKKLDDIIFNLPIGSHVRLLMSRDNEFNVNYSEISLRYIGYNIKRLIKEDTENKISVNYILENDEIDFNTDSYSNGDIINSIYDILITKYNFNELDIEKAKEYLDIFKDKLKLE